VTSSAFPALASTLHGTRPARGQPYVSVFPSNTYPNCFPTAFIRFRRSPWLARPRRLSRRTKLRMRLEIAKYSELAKSMMLGDEAGHAQTALSSRDAQASWRGMRWGSVQLKSFISARLCSFMGGSLEYFRDMVFNYPTLAESVQKVAALDGLNKL